MHAGTSSPSLGSLKDTLRQHVSLNLGSSLFVALLFCHRGWPYGSQKDRGCVLW